MTGPTSLVTLFVVSFSSVRPVLWSLTLPLNRLICYSKMLEQFLIFSKGGLVLFQAGQSKLAGEPIAQLVQTVLLEVRPLSSTS